jgi:peptidoglycan/LPS O-acetylase OafA/YrhL
MPVCGPTAPRLAPPLLTEAGRDALQALRVVAVLLLVAYHVALVGPGEPAGPAHKALVRLGGMGWIGTDLFLALAGFLAVGSRARSRTATAWLWRRALRVLPAFAVFLLVYLYLVPIAVRYAGGSAQTLRGFALARANQGYLWGMATNLLMAMGRWPGAALEPLLTLGVGVQLTVLAAFLVSRRRDWIPVAGIVVLECVGVALRALWLEGDPWRSYCFPLTRCDAFASGMAVALLLSHPGWGDELRRRRWLVLGLAASGLAAVVAVNRGLPVGAKATMLAGYPAIGAFSGAIVLVLSQVEHAGSWLRRVAVAGAAAYTVYLVKLPTVFMVRRALESWNVFTGLRGLLLLGALGALASGLIGGSLHLLVERPLLRGLLQCSPPASLRPRHASGSAPQG